VDPDPPDHRLLLALLMMPSWGPVDNNDIEQRRTLLCIFSPPVGVNFHLRVRLHSMGHWAKEMEPQTETDKERDAISKCQ